MDLLWIVLLMVLACSEARNMVNVSGELGQDVNLTCSFSSPDIIWVMEVHNRIRAGIGRTYSSVPTYLSPDLETKYSISGNRLLVRNLSAEDSRFYFCGRKDDGRTVYGDTIRLTTNTSGSPTPSTNICRKCASENRKEWQKEPVIIGLVALNGVLFAVVLGFICVSVKKKGCCCCSVKDSAEYILDQQEMQNPRYEEIQLPPAQFTSECIYSKAQHPGFMPRH
ncbi:hypothetical protein CHARACLAT_018413 [Characodon lateralis]|uniref:Immunoglobulin domain-containing protein n=1 Tax=Characodon lateralis TaxID=208331 RepID=A0ABU7EK81_9TELE|nr:hypothetical protein [Characodon lateralis]